MPTAVWTGSLGFGLISIPIRLYAAARSRHIQLHQLHDKCHTRLKQPLFCPTDNRIVDRSEVVKGYKFEKGEYVLIDNAELEKTTPRSGKFMEILAFVKESQIDPIYLDASYFAMPDKDADKPYQLLLKASRTPNALRSPRLRCTSGNTPCSSVLVAMASRFTPCTFKTKFKR